MPDLPQPTTNAAPIVAADAGKRKWRNFLIALAKLAVATALVYWLLHSGRLDWRAYRLIVVDRRALVWIAAGAAMVFCGQGLMAWRLQLLLRPEIVVSRRRVFGITLLGSFWSMVLPGLVGGDAVKALYLIGDAEHKRPQAVAAIVMDRVVGTYGLFALGVLGAALAWATGSFPGHRRALLLAPALLLGATGGVWFVGRLARSGRPAVAAAAAHLPAWLRGFGRALRDYGDRPDVLAKTVGLSALNHATIVFSFIGAAALLRDASTIAQHLALCPLGMTMNMVPLTPGGIGVAESAFSFLYESVGSPLGASIGLLGRFIQYLSFLLPGIAALLLARFGARSAGE
jgi:uncharacterized membrane protein YbhN (UPF0104 family)